MILSPILRPIISSPLHGIFGPALAPDGAILHWDADIDAFSEQTGGVHTFNHAVLSPQYQRNADGSYVNVGARPAVDVFGGKKWLRSCGAVTNMLTNSVFAGAVSGTPGTAPTGWSFAFSGGNMVADAQSLTFSAVANRHVIKASQSVNANTTYIYTFDAVTDGNIELQDILRPVNRPTGSTYTYTIDGVVAAENAKPTGSVQIGFVFVIGATGGTPLLHIGVGCNIGNVTGSVTLCCPQLTATAYPLPYVPTTAAGPVTQPASNATATNGSWFANPDGSPLWQALTGSPLTLATRVRMGVGSGDLPNNTVLSFMRSAESVTHELRESKSAGGVLTLQSTDGPAYPQSAAYAYSRGAIIRRFLQVNTAGTQFRVGYMIEGTHTTIQWPVGGGWTAFDGSFNPTTLYRLMLGYNNAYPMWFNKITAWPLQVSDARILEAMA